MSKLAFLLGIKRIFFIGIGGISMSGLALHFKRLGYQVCGSDRAKSQILQNLKRQGVEIFYNHDKQNLKDCQAVVYSSAIGGDNVELKFAKEQGLKIFKRSELLGKVLKEFKCSVGISGCHGKTTATAMLSNILIKSKLDPTVFLGGEYGEYGNYRSGNLNFAVAEACEYKKNFLDLKPTISVVLNVDNDHMDSYQDTSDLVGCFKQFVSDNLAVINADDNYYHAISNCTTVTYGIKNSATYYAKDIKKNDKGCSFTAYAYSKRCGRINLKVGGEYNIYNALSAFAVADVLGVSFGQIKSGLEEFCGVKRRNEYLGEKFALKWFADYAHHPTEIKAILSSFSNNGENFITVFQPHTYSRTELLMPDFIRTLKGCKNLIVYKTYPAREKYSKDGDAKTLYEKLYNENMRILSYAETPTQLEDLIKDYATDQDRVLLIGAGDIYDIGKKIIANDYENK